MLTVLMVRLSEFLISKCLYKRHIKLNSSRIRAKQILLMNKLTRSLSRVANDAFLILLNLLLWSTSSKKSSVRSAAAPVPRPSLLTLTQRPSREQRMLLGMGSEMNSS